MKHHCIVLKSTPSSYKIHKWNIFFYNSVVFLKSRPNISKMWLIKKFKIIILFFFIQWRIFKNINWGFYQINEINGCLNYFENLMKRNRVHFKYILKILWKGTEYISNTIWRLKWHFSANRGINGQFMGIVLRVNTF